MLPCITSKCWTHVACEMILLSRLLFTAYAHAKSWTIYCGNWQFFISSTWWMFCSGFKAHIHHFVWYQFAHEACILCCVCVWLSCVLTRPPDGAHLRDLSQSPAASCVTATLHLGVLAVQLRGTAAVSQSRETGAHTLVWRKEEETG